MSTDPINSSLSIGLLGPPQVTWDGSRVPSLAAGLPAPAASLIGRTTEFAEVTALLRRDDVRLHRLSLPGGASKTRLTFVAARLAARYFSDGAPLYRWHR